MTATSTGWPPAAERCSSEQSSGELQDDELRHPTDFTWVELLGRTRPRRGLFVAPVVGEAINQHIVPLGDRGGQHICHRLCR